MKQKLSSRPDILNRRRAISRSEIHELQKQVNTSAEAEAKALLEVANQGNYSLGKLQTKFALRWLRNKIWKQNGELRETPVAKVFGFRERGVIESLDKITFEGFRYQYNAEKGKYQTRPVYRCHSETGDKFDYAVDFWGRPEIVG